MSVHEMALKSENFSDLDLPISGLYLLAAPSTPAEARTTIIARAQTGESVSVAVVKRVIDSAKGRKPLSTTKPPPPAALNSKSKSGSHLPASKTHDDSAGECERLRERIEELEEENYRLKRSNLALRDEIGGGKPGLAEKLDSPLETLYEQGAANMVTMAPVVVMVAVTKLERLLVEYGIMPPSRRTEDPRGYARLRKQRAARHPVKPASDSQHDRVVAFMAEANGFLSDFHNRLQVWHEANGLLDAADRDAFVACLHTASNNLSLLAQLIDGRDSAS